MMETDFNVQGSVVTEFGRTIAADLVQFIETLPGKEDDAAGVLAIEAAVDSAEGEFPAPVAVECDVSRFDEVEIVTIP